MAVKRENPFFTKNGEYTYDITLDLNNPINAGLYSHLSRLNSVSEISEKRSAKLISDGRVYCNGTEIITAWTDKTVTIQVASGNSELNYFIGSDQLISQLNIRDEKFTPHEKYVKKLYPEIEFCLAPLYNRLADITINEWRHNKITSTSTYNLLLKPNYQDGDYIAQPFLCAYIKYVLQALGYSLVHNDIETSEWKDLYITHLNNTTKWQEMLPGWKVGDFLEQIELLFNACFVIDSRKREARLLFKKSFYEHSQRAHVTKIIDGYDAEMDEEASQEVHRSNVQYDFPDNEYFRLQCIPDHIYNAAKKGVIPLSWAEQYPSAGREGYLYKWFSKAENQTKEVLFHDEKTGLDYIYSSDTSASRCALVNAFHPIRRVEEAHTIKLEIMPVEMGEWDWWHYFDGRLQGEGSNLESKPTEWMIPTIDAESSPDDDEEEGSGLIGQIRNGSGEVSESKSPIFLAFHQGLNNNGGGGENTYPTPFTFECFTQRILSAPNLSFSSTLRLSRFEELLYSGSYEIDTTKAVTFISYDPNLFDPRSVFECRNKLYVCREIEYTLNNQGRSGAWSSIFHPIKISDTEAYQRWILEDGKWRDNGMWLDNGRWLDE